MVSKWRPNSPGLRPIGVLDPSYLLCYLFFPLPPYPPPPRRALGGQEALPDRSPDAPPSFLDVGETLLERLGAVLVGSWAVLGGSWATSAPSWAVLGSLGPSWGSLGLSWGASWEILGPSWDRRGANLEPFRPVGVAKIIDFP